MRKRSRRRRFEPDRWGLLAGTAILSFFLGIGVGHLLGRRASGPAPDGDARQRSAATAPDPSRSSAAGAPGPKVDRVSQRRPATETPTSYPPADGARVALVIDDLGRSVRQVDDLARLGVPLSYSVLPFESHTAEVVERLRQSGAEILCHLPMQPRNGKNPGPGALTAEMGADELAAATRRAVARVEGAVGVNNHMGSGLSADGKAMQAIVGAVSVGGLFYLDSRTSADSVGYRTARALGVPAAERQVFLDVDDRPESIRAQFVELLDLARSRGSAIAIGHPHPTTLAVLGEELPRARQAGYEFVPVSYLLDRAGEVVE